MLKFRSSSVLPFLLAGALLPGIATAQPLPSGGIAIPVDSVNTPGLVIQDTLIPFTISNGLDVNITGVFQDRVLKLADNSLSFNTVIRVDAGSTGHVAGFGRATFINSAVDVSSDPTSIGTNAPAEATRAADGSTVGFSFVGIPAGQWSTFSEVHTGALAYNDNGTANVFAVDDAGPYVCLCAVGQSGAAGAGTRHLGPSGSGPRSLRAQPAPPGRARLEGRSHIDAPAGDIAGAPPGLAPVRSSRSMRRLRSSCLKRVGHVPHQVNKGIFQRRLTRFHAQSSCTTESSKAGLQARAIRPADM